MENKLPNRKTIRLQNYDYSQAGYYFVTICTDNRQHILGEITVGDAAMETENSDIKGYPYESQTEFEDVGVGFHADPKTKLTQIGKEVQKSILKLSEIYDGTGVDQYIVMPNHIHLIITLEGGHGNPPLHDIVGRLKSYTTKRYNQLNNTSYLTLWQRSYFEHIIRNEKELQEIREYIVNNPAKWELDKYYMD